MEQNVKDGDRNVEPPRAACRVPPRAGTPCDIREGGPITPWCYAELFWEEA
jgi:hypothetical protein